MIELLVVIAVIGVLGSLLLPSLGRAKRKAKTLEEVSAARQLVLAGSLYSQEHEDRLFPGYAADAATVDHRGERVGFPVNARYPWRLLPYVGGSMELLYAADNRARLQELRRLEHHEYIYAVSVYPSLGINSYFIGGNETEFPADAANRRFGPDTVPMRLGQVRRPSSLIMFASARSATVGLEANGYYHVTPPYLKARRWDTSWSGETPPARSGFIAMRHGGKAVAGMVDGHVELLNWEEMQDMRRWSNTAVKDDSTLGGAP